MFDLGPMMDKFNDSGKRVVYRAVEESRQRDHHLISATHIFMAICQVENGVLEEAIQAAGVSTSAIKQALGEELAKLKPHVGRKMYIADTTRDVFNRALKRARQQGELQISASDLMISLFADTKGIPTLVMRQLGADLDKMLDAALNLSSRRLEVEHPAPVAESEQGQPIPVDSEAWRELGKLFNRSAQAVISKAIGESHRFNHPGLSAEHLFLVVWQVNQPLFVTSLKEAGIDPEVVSAIIHHRLRNLRAHAPFGEKFYLAPDGRAVLSRALEVASRRGQDSMESGDLLIALLSDPEGIFAQIMRLLWADPGKVAEAITRNDLPQRRRVGADLPDPRIVSA
ncbi:MAG TPA: Clp protease N-terminal domain-containing protein [Blastocatellia bacterium]|nr:Clp protease N-terminal domain-containing protein [Blastocatellia bacterium]